jgi:hypothetical protein
MGTSQSSSGSPSGVPMIPPWVPELPSMPDGQGENDQGKDTPAVPEPMHLTPQFIAPLGRFRSARTSLGKFGRSGTENDMRRGLGHYVRNGLGGSKSATRRFSGSARTAGSLYGALSSVAAGRPSSPGSPLDPVLLNGRSADDIINAVVEAVRPTDGTQDTEASRNAILDALSELLERFPGVDLLNLSEEEKVFVIERYLARDVFNRIRLDVGRIVQEKAPNATVALSRMKEIFDFVRETIAAKFRALFKAGESLNASRIAQMGVLALQDSFDVFEEYLE